MSLELDSKGEMETSSERLPTKRRAVKDVLIFSLPATEGGRDETQSLLPSLEETLITKRGKES